MAALPPQDSATYPQVWVGANRIHLCPPPRTNHALPTSTWKLALPDENPLHFLPSQQSPFSSPGTEKSHSLLDTCQSHPWSPQMDNCLNDCHFYTDICHSPRPQGSWHWEAWDRPEPLHGYNETPCGKAPAISPLGNGPAGESPRACLPSILCPSVLGQTILERGNRAMSQQALEVARHYNGLVLVTGLTTQLTAYYRQCLCPLNSW